MKALQHSTTTNVQNISRTVTVRNLAAFCSSHALRKIYAVALCAFALIFAGCGGAFAQNANSGFGGRYLFRAESHMATVQPQFVEAGILTADGQGHFSLMATYNGTSTSNQSYTFSPNIITSGTYTMNPSSNAGTMHVIGAPDAFSTDAQIFCTHSGDYCSIGGAQAGIPWQGKLWRDNSNIPDPFTMIKMGVSSYVFETDSSQNFFIESGVVSFDMNGHTALKSTFNNTLPGSIILGPDVVWGCGSYGFRPDYGNIQFTQWFCSNPSAITDTVAIWCMNDGSLCVAVPDAWEAGSWIMELRRQ